MWKGEGIIKSEEITNSAVNDHYKVQLKGKQ